MGYRDDVPENGAVKQCGQCLRSQLALNRTVTASRWARAALGVELMMTKPTTEACRSTRFGVITGDRELAGSEGLQWQTKNSHWRENFYIFELHQISQKSVLPRKHLWRIFRRCLFFLNISFSFSIYIRINCEPGWSVTKNQIDRRETF